mgnify:CR=1 FL=1
MFETTMDPAKRKLLRIDLTDAVEAEEMFTKLMGEVPSPTNGEDMQKRLAELDATPEPVIARLKEILKPQAK